MNGKMRERLGLGLALVGVVVAAGGAWALLQPGGSNASDASGLPSEARAPAAEQEDLARSNWLQIPAAVVSFPRLDGKRASLDDYRGRIVLLNFWGTWCPPCRVEIPELVKLQKRLAGQNATIVSIAVDSGTPAHVRAFARQHGLNYPIWMSGSDRVIRYYRAMGFPTTLLIDANGVIRRRYLGPQRADQLLADVQHLERQEPSSSPASTARPGAGS